jgi:hypothetical protein
VTETERLRFLGMNIKGTPAMPAKAVEHDLKVGRTECSVLVTQEFRWPWYWKTLRGVLDRGKRQNKWRASPGLLRGLRRPVRGAQAVMWDNEVWRKVDKRVHLLHDGVARVSEDRFIRAVLLEHRKTKLRCWFLTTHFVVGGDERGDSPLRKKIMAVDLRRLDALVQDLRETGYPIIGQADLNIHVGSWAYHDLMEIREEHGMKFHGTHGVEFLFTVDGERTKMEVLNDWIVPTTRLRTDHEGRGITYKLAKR